MNEVELLRAQLAAEREHSREAASLCAAVRARDPPARGSSDPLAVSGPGLENIYLEFIYSYRNYLLFNINKEQARGAAFLERLGRLAQSDAERAELEPLRQALATASGTLARLRAVPGAPRASAEGSQALEELTGCAALIERLAESRSALEALAERRYGVDDWRRAAHVDADSILEERKLRAQVLRHGSVIAAL